MRFVKTLQDVIIQLREIAAWKDLITTKDWDFRKLRIKNASPAVDPNDYVILAQLPKFKKTPEDDTLLGPRRGAGSTTDPIEERPFGARNGTNVNFTTSKIPKVLVTTNNQFLRLSINGVLLDPWTPNTQGYTGNYSTGAGDYILVKNHITLIPGNSDKLPGPPISTDQMECWYWPEVTISSTIRSMVFEVITSFGFVTEGLTGLGDGGSLPSIGVPALRVGFQIYDPFKPEIIYYTANDFPSALYAGPWLPLDEFGLAFGDGWINYTGRNTYFPNSGLDPALFSDSRFTPLHNQAVRWFVTMWIDGSTRAFGPPYPDFWIKDAYMKITYTDGTVIYDRPTNSSVYNDVNPSTDIDDTPRDIVISKDPPTTGGTIVEQLFHSPLSDYATVVWDQFSIIDKSNI